MNIRITRVFYSNGFTIVEGLVPARCALGYYHVVIKVEGMRLVESRCECRQPLCSHAVKLHLAFIRSLSR
ncbi:hypothetical protein DDW09_02125 [Sulfolobus sp. SCGC AB-777_L09]|jgi:hypothetical protein|nr:hypothetical protein DDW09_02125 [Sulfolobus sp. SCGC AB-777_L09]